MLSFLLPLFFSLAPRSKSSIIAADLAFNWLKQGKVERIFLCAEIIFKILVNHFKCLCPLENLRKVKKKVFFIPILSRGIFSNSMKIAGSRTSNKSALTLKINNNFIILFKHKIIRYKQS